jgi:hypothetical protein
LLGLDTEKQPRLVLRCGLIRVPVLVPLHFCAVKVNECNRDLATVEPPTSSALAETFRVFEQLDDVVNDIVNFAAANDAPGLEGKYPFNQLLHSFEVHYPIRFPRFTTVG